MSCQHIKIVVPPKAKEKKSLSLKDPAFILAAANPIAYICYDHHNHNLFYLLLYPRYIYMRKKINEDIEIEMEGSCRYARLAEVSARKV